MNRILFVILLLISNTAAMAQFGNLGRSNGIKGRGSDDISFLNPKEFIIAGISVSGTQFLDKDALITISKLVKGQRITVPSEATSNAVKNLWAQDLLDDVKLTITEIKGDSIYFDITVAERPRLMRIDIKGLRKGQISDINAKLDHKKGKIVNQNLLNTISSVIKKFFHEKGYLNTDVTISQTKDTTEINHVILTADVNKHARTVINRITFEGNKKFTDAQLRRYLKKIGQRAFYKIFGPGKFVESRYEESKVTMIEKMQEKGYKDAYIMYDTIKRHDDKSVNIFIKVHEGNQYYLGNITWVGNAKYSTKVLNAVLGMEKGSVYSDQLLNRKLNSSPNGDDVSSLYMNDGYLTFNIDPVQTKIYGDTIDLELRIYEGPQYTINKVTVKGNEATNDRVVLREIRTKPGQKFSKEAIIRSTREIAQLGNFDDQKTEPKPININPSEGTVDIEYTVVEKSSDQLELSAGIGGGNVIGTLGFTFNNFSMRDLFNGKAWRPLPRGDGQKLSIKGQTNGKQYRSFSLSFSEPWFGGKKPIYFGVSLNTSVISNGQSSDSPEYSKTRVNGMSISLGRRLKIPDDYFQINTSFNLQQLKLTNSPSVLFRNGVAYNLNVSQEVSRNSVDSPIYPSSGSNLKLTLQATPPYSLLNNINYKTASDQEKYRFTEYFKIKFESQWFQRISGKLVLKAQSQFGFLGCYNQTLGISPFERFKLGGDGMQQGVGDVTASEIIAMRGYTSVVPVDIDQNEAQRNGSAIFSKYILELRHPLINSPQATVFLLLFAEGGNTWRTMKEFTPFNVRKSAGIGARIFLPIFGLLGLDYGYGFDKVPSGNYFQKPGWSLQFTMAQSLNAF